MTNNRSQRNNKTSGTAQRAPQDREGNQPAGGQQNPLLRLHQQVGNQQVSRMLAQRATPEEEELVQAQHDATLQRATPEEEELVQAQHDATLQRAAPEEDELVQAQHDATLQRAAPEEDELVQASPEVGLEGGPISQGLAQRIQSQRGGGSPLAEATRAPVEQALGASLEDVRVHTTSESAALNRSISAKAFTTGNDIFLGEGASAGDSRLMAHELTHVVQQRSMSTSGPMRVNPAGDSYEQHADQVAASIGSAPAQRTNEEQSD